MNIEILEREKANVSYAQVVELMHEAFQERLEQGLNYSCSSMDVTQFMEKTKNGCVYVAIDKDTGILAGTTPINFHQGKKRPYGYMEFVAISNDYKRFGIASRLVRTITDRGKAEGCDYILSDTSVNAGSAVKFHLKNGFKIIGLESYRSTNYWSYVFRMQLEPSLLWNNPLFLKLHYWFSYIFIKTTRDIYGNDTAIGKFYKRVKGLCKN